MKRSKMYLMAMCLSISMTTTCFGAALQPVSAAIKSSENKLSTVKEEALMEQEGAVSAVKSGKWVKDRNGWWYKFSDGSYPKKEWEKIDGKYYYFDSSGYMKTGWIKLSGKWYYLESSGARAEGWKKLGGKWYYLTPKTGVMKTGWYKVSGKYYYSDSSGAMKTGWLKKSGKWYYLNIDGARAYGWKKTGGKWYYLTPGTGVMVTGSVKIDGENYKFNSDGSLRSGQTSPAEKVVDIYQYITDSSVSRVAEAIGGMKISSNSTYKNYCYKKNLEIGILTDRMSPWGSGEIHRYYQLTDVRNMGDKSVSFYGVKIGDSYETVKLKLTKKYLFQNYESEKYKFYCGNAAVLETKFKDGKLASYTWKLRYTS